MTSYLGYMVAYHLSAESEDEALELAQELLSMDTMNHGAMNYEVVETHVDHQGDDAYTVEFEVEITPDPWETERSEEELLTGFEQREEKFKQADEVNAL